MDMRLFTDIKPTWETIAFDEGIERIPSSGRNYGRNYLYRKPNPLDRDIAICFRPPQTDGFLYYVPSVDQAKLVRDPLLPLSHRELSELFDCRIKEVYPAPSKVRSCTRYFLYEMVIGESYVFRKFCLKISCAHICDDEYKCTVFPVREVCRYVFGEYGVLIEKPDRSYAFTTIDKLPSDKTYDTIVDMGRPEAYDLYEDYMHKVKMHHKDGIVRMMKELVSPQYRFFKLGYDELKKYYSQAEERYDMDEDIPDVILSELDKRCHRPYTSLRLTPHLTVVTWSRLIHYHEPEEQIRFYFDEHRSYCFVQNPVTGKWHSSDPCELLFSETVGHHNVKFVQKDLFDGTCMQQYVGYVLQSGTVRNIVNLGILFAVSRYLYAEQAIKTDIDLFNAIYTNISQNPAPDGTLSLPEFLGITGPQIKYLKDMDLPYDLRRFGKCMRLSDFIEAFPDVKKRMFAVCFYLGKYRYNRADDLTIPEICACAQTLNSLERTDPDKREYLLREYRDYVRMHSRYTGYLNEIDTHNPLIHEIRAYGDIPLNIKPSAIHDYHSKMIRLIDILQSSNKIERYTKEIESRKDKEAKDWEYSDGRYSILMPDDASSIISEGGVLCHCVGTAGYIDAMARGDCTILFLRNNIDIRAPLITIEVRDGAIRQCYGYGDRHNHDEHIRDFIMDYAARKKLTITATIYTEE